VGQLERLEDIVDLGVRVEVVIDGELGDGADVLTVGEECEEEKGGDQGALGKERDQVEIEFWKAQGVGMVVDQKRAMQGCSWS
jgi:hypothetical protein